MKKSRLLLYIGMPIFGFSLTALATVWSDLIYINIIPFFLGFYITEVWRVNPPQVATFLIIMAFAVFWLPVAYGIDQIYGHYARKSQRKRNRDKRRKSRDIFGSR